MSTPEGAIKKKVRDLLDEFDIRNAKDAGKFERASGWYYMPGQSGFGVRGIPDFVGHFFNNFFSVETKAPGKEPTGFQALQINAIGCSGGAVFIIDGDAALEQFHLWLLCGGRPWKI